MPPSGVDSAELTAVCASSPHKAAVGKLTEWGHPILLSSLKNTFCACGVCWEGWDQKLLGGVIFTPGKHLPGCKNFMPLHEILGSEAFAPQGAIIPDKLIFQIIG